MKITLSPLEWGLFANELSLLSSLAMIGGGVMGILEHFPRWQISVYSLIAGIIVFILEYPRSRITNLKCGERKFQGYLEPCIIFLGFYGRNYYVRFVMYICFSLPCFVSLPTFVGAACICTASFIYLKAAVCGFQWQPVYKMPLNSMSSTSSETHKYSSLHLIKETVC